MPVALLFLEIASAHKQHVQENESTRTVLQLIKTLQQLRKINRRVSLNTAIPLIDCVVAPNLTINAVLSSSNRKEEWEFLKLLATQSPLSSGMEPMLSQVHSMDVEVRDIPSFRNQEGEALIWANLLQSAAISFDTSVPWLQAWIDTCLITLDNVGQLAEAPGKVRNISQPDHVTEHKDWLVNLGCTESPNASDFWENKDDRFPGLRFLDRVRSQIDNLSTSGAPYKQALKSLGSLNLDSLAWKGQGEPSYSEKVASGEHDTRRELSKFKDDVTGQEYVFDRHAYFTGGLAGRIHFRVAPEESKFVVAHVGLKL